MKKLFFYISILMFAIIFTNCEDVINVNLKNENPKLVIDAVIKWQKGTTGENQKIILSTTSDFYSNDVPPASGATVTITNSTNTVFNFVETPNTGEYLCNNFIPIINETYILEVIHNGQTYTATDKLYATPVIQYVEQKSVPPIGGGEDQIQIKFFFQDNGAEDNFYLVGIQNPNYISPDYGVISDEFFQGNIMFGFYANDNLVSGQILPLYLQGISNSYFNYMNKLIAIGSTNNGNPFATPPVTLRGNLINQTNPDNYPLGYFSLGEVDTRDHIVQ
jgi:hypothetical protein